MSEREQAGDHDQHEDRGDRINGLPTDEQDIGDLTAAYFLLGRAELLRMYLNAIAVQLEMERSLEQSVGKSPNGPEPPPATPPSPETPLLF